MSLDQKDCLRNWRQLGLKILELGQMFYMAAWSKQLNSLNLIMKWELW
ncbi:unnamed protein product [Callosobruchus maculatus]|uniref:Uncharacterized protein n=1 Tax=Callosobruchus maculatus TaxID=64391 RepID=A0A653DSK0_CALMS|nr:unnamed protein product [Callosobruchus maculatus]